MLRVITGPIHPDLEQALVDDVRVLKDADALAPIALIVPSSALAERLKRRLTVESHLPLLNIHCYTFHQLTLRLSQEMARFRQATNIPLQIVDDFYFRQLVHYIVKRKLSGLEALDAISPSPGTWKGLWATIRDLKDAAVSPSIALGAVADGIFEPEDQPWLLSLFRLHAAVEEASRSLGIGSPDDLTASLDSNPSRSSFLRRMTRVLYYGFYDLTQVQLSFFEAVIQTVPTTLYFPLESRSAFGFARQFFDRHILPHSGSHEDRGNHARTSSSTRVELTVFNVIGADEELATVCRKILTLVEVNGYRFDEIGVVVRTLEPYCACLQQVFDRHLVPFVSTAERPLLREPVAKALLRLASLPVNDFDHVAVVDVVTASFYRGEAQELHARPDCWRNAVATLGITKGEGEWIRLAAPKAASILHDSRADPEDMDRTGPIDDPVQLAILWSRVSRLIRDCRALPLHGSISLLTDAFRALATMHFHVPGLTVPLASDEPEPTIGSLVKLALDRLIQVDPLGSDVRWEDWVDLFNQALIETAIPIESQPHQGVQVLDAMTARGLTFRALFVIGLNDKIFPRVVREDPFLRDRQRAVLQATLGYKVDDKLSGHEEERLLFELLIGSATQRLCLSYQRADEDGRVLAPSSFLGEVVRDCRFVTRPEETVPRRLTARIRAVPSIQEILPAQELTLSWLLQGVEVLPLMNALGLSHRLFERGLASLKIIERASVELGSFDGLLKPRVEKLSAFDRDGISPTSLERYARCPFQYFAEEVLRLESVRKIQGTMLPALTMGTFIHESLRLAYEKLVALHWPEASVAEADIRVIGTVAVSQVFDSYAVTQGTGRALLWTLAREQVAELVFGAIASDQEDYRKTGFRPHAFEMAANGSLRLQDDQCVLMKIHGKLDRVDVRSDPPALRVVDYKYKQGPEMAPLDHNLTTAAVRGVRLQPPFYASMDLPGLPAPSEVQFLYLGPHWEKPIVPSKFETSVLEGNIGTSIRRTIRTLVEGIARGEFFILPDGYCDQCAYSSACRRNDAMVWWRSYRSPEARVLRQVRKQKVADE